MREHQESRRRFVESNPGFAESKTPPRLWGKFFEESKEAAIAFWQYFWNPTEATRTHLGEELIDVIFIVMDMATFANINIEKAFTDKLEKDKKRFPPGTVMKRSDYRRRKVELGERKR